MKHIDVIHNRIPHTHIKRYAFFLFLLLYFFFNQSNKINKRIAGLAGREKKNGGFYTTAANGRCEMETEEKKKKKGSRAPWSRGLENGESNEIRIQQADTRKGLSLFFIVGRLRA